MGGGILARFDPLGAHLRGRLDEIARLAPLRLLRRHWRVGYGLTVLAIAVAIIAAININRPDKAPDFIAFWAAAGHAFGPIYDSDFISPLQPGGHGPRPFAYPPTFLLLILPLGLVPLKAAYLVWVTASVTAFVACGRQLTRWVWLALYSPTLLFAAMIGQTTLIVGGAASLGLWLACAQPIAAGVLLGVAAAIKPQLLLLVPVALALTRDWRALAVAGATAGALALAATAVFGLSIWVDWLASLTAFRAINDRLAIPRLGVFGNPLAMAAMLAVAVVAMVDAARRGERVRLILAALGGGLLLSPHAAFYDSAVVLPAALALIGRNWRLVPIAALLLGAGESTLGLALTVLPLALIGQRTAETGPERGADSGR